MLLMLLLARSMLSTSWALMLVDLLGRRRGAEDVSATSLTLCSLLHGKLIGKHLGISLAHLVDEASAATQPDCH